MSYTRFGLALVALFAIQIALPTPAAGESAPDLSPEALAHFHLLNHLSLRLRSNTLFNNEQSVDHGVQVNHVNVGAGNLTFNRRDLVVPSRIPLVFTRVYDSRSESIDLGPGWRIAATETIEVRGERIRLLDESNSSVVFRRDGERFVPELPANTSVLSIRKLRGSKLEATHQGGWIRTYQLIENEYRLVTVVDRYKNVVSLQYNRGLLDLIASPSGRSIHIFRHKSGRVRSIEDGNGRAVRFAYDERGRLTSVFDVGGNEWQYGYDRKGRLISIRSPEGFEELTAKVSGNSPAFFLCSRDYGQCASIFTIGASDGTEQATTSRCERLA